jgi:hypothetical protein
MSPVKHAVMMPATGTAGDLLKSARPSLTGWYADPIAAAEAQALFDRTERRLRSRLCRGGRCFPLHVLRMICHHWLQSDSALDYRQLFALACDDSERALVELVYGHWRPGNWTPWIIFSCSGAMICWSICRCRGVLSLRKACGHC